MSSKSFLFVSSFVVLLLAIIPFNSVAGDNPWSGKVRPGFMAGDGDVGTDFYLDVLIPLYGDQKQLFFFNPNFRFDDNDGNEQNIGFGYRSLVSGNKYILGANAYYDTMESEAGHRYQQWGVGAELLSHWFDVRANYYNVFGDDENILSGSGGASSYFFSGNSLMSIGGSIEQALDGFDAEVSVLVPGISDVMETRLAATYYRYDADYAKDPDGWRGRIEVRPVQAVNLSVEHRDDDLRGSDTFVGAYFEIPFSIENLFSGKNPFEGAGDAWTFGKGVRQLEERMTEKVVRDRHIVAVQSGTATGGSEVPVVDDAMIFVNQDTMDDKELQDGSFEHPFATLTQAAEDDRYLPGAWIYVFTSESYYYNTQFTLLDDQVFWGQGYDHPIYGLGGGENPVLDGGAEAVGPVITLANNNEVMGFTIQKGVEGVYGNNIFGANIHDNTVRVNYSPSSGIHIYNKWTPAEVNGATLSYRFANNLIAGNSGDGIFMSHSVAGTAPIDGLTIENLFDGNRVGDNGSAGITVFSDLSTEGDNSAISNLAITNTFTKNLVGGANAINGGDGIWVESRVLTTGNDSPVSNVEITHTYTDNQVVGNVGSGIRDNYLSVDSQGLNSNISNVALGSYLSGNTLTGNGTTDNRGSGYTQQEIEVETSYASESSNSNVTLTIEVVDNIFSGNGRYGFHSEQYAVRGSSLATTSDSGFSLSFNGNTVENNGSIGVYSDSDGRGGDNTWMHYTFSDNRISNNGSYGLYLYIDPSDGELIDKRLFLQGNTITDNDGHGVDLYVNGRDTEDFSGDFGGGTLGSTGSNTFSGNGTWDIYHDGNSGMDVSALNNTWTNNADPESTICDGADTYCRGDIITQP